MKHHFFKTKFIAKARIIFIVLAVLMLAIPFIPHQFVKDAGAAESVRVTYMGRPVDLAQVDLDLLLEGLSSIQCIRTAGYGAHTMEDVIEIDFHENGKPMHVVLGAYHYCYHNKGLFQEFTIINHDAVYAKIVDAIFS